MITQSPQLQQKLFLQPVEDTEDFRYAPPTVQNALLTQPVDDVDDPYYEDCWQFAFDPFATPSYASCRKMYLMQPPRKCNNHKMRYGGFEQLQPVVTGMPPKKKKKNIDPMMYYDEDVQPMADYEGERTGDFLRKTLIHGCLGEYGFYWEEGYWCDDGFPLSLHVKGMFSMR